MSTHFKKTMLNVGAYESGDGMIVVTPHRLKHWAKEVKRVQSAGYQIPVHWDHPDLVEHNSPIRMSASEGKSRTSERTCGRLKDFRVLPSGNAAELTIETLTPSATEKVKANAVFISPVLFDRWKDGAGNKYQDTIGSVDLVDYPVDHSQGPFVPAMQAMSCIRMSCSPTVFRMSAMAMSDDPKKKPPMYETDGDEGGMDMDSDGDGVDNQDVSMDPGTTPADDETQGDPIDPEPSTGTSVSDVVQLLSQLQVVLPDDTTTTNFLERLRPALMTAVAANAQPAPEEPATSLPPEQQQQPQLAEQPQIATMALKIKQLETDKINSARSALNRRLKTILESGRCTPHEFQQMKTKLGVQKMSLTATNTVKAGDTAVWIRARESTPAGSVWTPAQRVQKMGVKPVAAPEGWSAKATMTQETQDDAVKALLPKHLRK